MEKDKILFLGRFPPPVHGAARMNELYLKSKLINDKFDIKKLQISYVKSIEDIGKFSLYKILGIFLVAFKLFYRLIFFRPKIIYFEVAPAGFAFFRDSFFVFICKIFQKKIIFHFHAKGMNEVINSKLKLLYSKLVFRKTKAILLSKLLYKGTSGVSKVISRKNIYIVPNGVYDELNEKEFKEIIKIRNKNKKPTLLFLSNMIESKGPLEVLEICNLLNKDGLDFECLFIGAWPDEEIKNKWNGLVKKYNLEKKCTYLGKKYGDEKKEIIKKANFLLFPTKYKLETFGLVIIEAFMFGIPVLSYDNASIKNIISNSNLGYISYNQDFKELYDYLRKNIKKKFNAEWIRNYFKKNYDFNIAEEKLLKVFESEIEGGI